MSRLPTRQGEEPQFRYVAESKLIHMASQGSSFSTESYAHRYSTVR